MHIEHPDVQRAVTEYDFTFSSSHFISITIDPKFDSIEFGEKEIKAVLGGRERNGVKTPPEEVVIFMHQLISYAKRERVINDFTPEQQETIKVLLKNGSKLIH